MKFVIKSLLFVNLLLQMTGSLRKCFDQDQNIMLTIIMLAFSIIGLIGLVIGNRFILIVFSASMLLVLIASITIYAIGRADGHQDSLRPKVPYYMNIPLEVPVASLDRQAAPDGSAASSSGSLGASDEGRLKSLVGKWLHKSSSSSSSGSLDSNSMSASNSSRGWPARRRPNNYLDKSARGASRQRANATLARQRTTTTNSQSRSRGSLPSAPPLTISPLLLDDYSDEPQQQQQALVPVEIPLDPRGRLLAVGQQRSLPALVLGGSGLQQQQQQPGVKLDNQQAITTKTALRELAPDADQMEQPVGGLDPAADGQPNDPSFAQVENEQWVAYERHLYERYLNIVSQSIDLVFLGVLAAWMALLLDEDSDQCFGQSSSASSSSRSRRTSGAGLNAAKEAPIYNYNGVRYSIRPDVGDSPPHVVVR